MREVPFKYGENGRGFAVASLPDDYSRSPVIVLFNAGMLHRAEPYRLNVLIARELANVGFISVRVDLSGKGDTPSRDGLSNRDSVNLDWTYLKKSITSMYGSRAFVLGGLCSGADNAIKIGASDESVKGLLLLDPISLKDDKFKQRKLYRKIFNWYRWTRLPSTLTRKAFSLVKKSVSSGDYDVLDGLRDEPTVDDMQQCFQNIVNNSGKALMFFTSYALDYYNEQGQFCRALKIPNLAEHCEEVFIPTVSHLYRVQTHRDRLIEKVKLWCSNNLQHFQTLI